MPYLCLYMFVNSEDIKIYYNSICAILTLSCRGFMIINDCQNNLLFQMYIKNIYHNLLSMEDYADHNYINHYFIKSAYYLMIIEF